MAPPECNCAGPIRGRACRLRDIRPVDSRHHPAHISRVSKKPHKVEEATASYAAKKPAAVPVSTSGSAPTIRYATPEEARQAAEEVFKVHEKLFRKLAQ